MQHTLAFLSAETSFLGTHPSFQLDYILFPVKSLRLRIRTHVSRTNTSMEVLLFVNNNKST